MKLAKTNILILILSLSVAAMGGLIYKQQTDQDRDAAIGDLSGLSPRERVAYTDGGDFIAKKAPKASDWLAQHDEAGQGYPAYLKGGANLPNKEKNVIYILPVGDFPKKLAPDLQMLLEYTRAYYHPMKVIMKPAVADDEVKARSRINGSVKQWLAPDVMRWMRPQLNRDAYAMISVTMTDLYPDPKWNYVFGMASFRQRVGVFSFARYVDKNQSTVLRRAAKVLTHEIGHMFSIQHCIFYQCNMNGANHRDEMDATPMHLCPVCLRKMQYAVKFDVAERYQKLHAFYQKYKLEDEAKWVKSRMDKLAETK